MKKFFREFKEFIMRGNVLDLSVAVIIGAAFQAIVTSLTDNIISPVIGIFTQMNFDELMLIIPFGDSNVTIKYGAFITAVINFLIMAFVIFILVKAINKVLSFGKKKEDTPAPTTKKCPFCQSDIDLKAIRCPHCTSVLEDETKEDNDK